MLCLTNFKNAKHPTDHSPPTLTCPGLLRLSSQTQSWEHVSPHCVCSRAAVSRGSPAPRTCQVPLSLLRRKGHGGALCGNWTSTFPPIAFKTGTVGSIPSPAVGPGPGLEGNGEQITPHPGCICASWHIWRGAGRATSSPHTYSLAALDSPHHPRLIPLLDLQDQLLVSPHLPHLHPPAPSISPALLPSHTHLWFGSESYQFCFQKFF